MGDLALLERFDTFADARNNLRRMGEAVAEWAGIPMPIDGERLVIEPSYRFAQTFERMDDDQEEDGIKVRNVFWSHRYRCEVVIYEEDGQIRHQSLPSSRIAKELRTAGCSFAWGIEQEQRALKLLGTMVRHHTFKMYLLSGMFLETSKRSRITYLFRKLRPTVAFDTKGKTLRMLCALCMHPIGYYADSWAGAMCPTDDVIAHLSMMRSDEPMLWKRSSQHPQYRPEAGV